MQQTPHQPRNKAGDRKFSVFSNTDTAGNRCQFARHEWLQRGGQSVARQSGGDEFANVPALMLGNRRETRKGPTIRSCDMGRVSDYETVGIARNGEIFFNWHGSVGFNSDAECPCEWDALHTGAPQHRGCLDLLSAD